jgi:predicted nucleic acid-binding protein
VNVVSDTSPICYLCLIEEIDLLPALYERIYIPEAVAAELRHPKAPAILQSWIGSSPVWLEIVPVSWRVPPDMERLQTGEKGTILLAEDLDADLVIMDDRRAREVAVQHGLEVTGLLGVLDQAAEKGLVSLSAAFERLQRTSFRTTPQFLQHLLDKHSH